MFMWLNRIFRQREIRNLQTAIRLAEDMQRSLSEAPPGKLAPAQTFMRAVQVRSLLDLLNRDMQQILRGKGSPFSALLDNPPDPAPEKTPAGIAPLTDGQEALTSDKTPTSKDAAPGIAPTSESSPSRETLAEAVAALQPLLKSRLSILFPQAPRNQEALAGAAPVGKANEPAHANDDKPASAARPEDASVLWAVTEKLYVSWAVRALLVLVVIGFATAMGGSIVIGTQTWNVRKNLDDAQEKAQAEMRAISETTQTRLTKESETVLTRLAKESETALGGVSKESGRVLTSLRERGAEIDGQLQKAEKQVTELKTGSEEIKANIIKELQKSLRDKESSLQEAILKPLMEMRDRDLASLTVITRQLDKTLKEMTSDADDKKTKLTGLGPKLDLLRTYADQSDKIGNALATINVELAAANKGRMNAEAEAGEARLRKTAAETSATEAEKLRQRVGEVVKGASDETLKHNRALALVESQLKALEEKLRISDGKLKELDNKQADLDGKQKASEGKLKTADSKQKDADGKLYVLDGQVSLQEEHVKSIVKRIELLDKDIPKAPATPIAVSPPAQTIDPSSLSAKDLRPLQQGLVAEGFPVSIDGVFGAKTRAAIQGFQAKMKADATGLLTREQFDALKRSRTPR